MRCVNCQRTASPDDTQCPYCGCPVLSAVGKSERERLADNVRKIWDESRMPDNVVPLVRPGVPLWHRLAPAADLAIWLIVWGLVTSWLGVAASLYAWIAFALAVTVYFVALAANGPPSVFLHIGQDHEPQEVPGDTTGIDENPRVSGL